MNFGSEIKDVSSEARRRYVGNASPQEAGLRDWFALGGTYFIITTTASSLKVEVTDDSWRAANGSDCQRFFWAARDSIIPRASPLCDRKSIGWSAVQIYYSSFYLLLAFLRLYGSSLVYLSSDECQKICAAPNASLLQPGVYELSINLGARTTILLEKKNYSGFHEGFWKFADQKILDLGTDMAAGNGMYSSFSPQLLQQAILSMEELRAWLGHAGTPGRKIGWMSSLRNELNYRLAKRAWSPNYRDGAVDIPRLRQDVISILRGDKNNLGAMLRLDDDVRSMIERVSVLYRNLIDLSGVASLSRY